jgi:hypothetical protein
MVLLLDLARFYHWIQVLLVLFTAASGSQSCVVDAQDRDGNILEIRKWLEAPPRSRGSRSRQVRM